MSFLPFFCLMKNQRFAKLVGCNQSQINISKILATDNSVDSNSIEVNLVGEMKVKRLSSQ